MHQNHETFSLKESGIQIQVGKTVYSKYAYPGTQQLL